MSRTGGTVVEYSLDNRLYTVPAETEVTINLGGYNNKIVQVGSGSPITQVTKVSSMVEGLETAIDNDQDDLGALKRVQEKRVLVPFSITLADGNTYQGDVQIVDEIKYSTQKATASINLAGNPLEKQ